MSGEYKYFHIDPLNGTVTLTKDVPDNELVQPVTLVVKVTLPLSRSLTLITGNVMSFYTIR